MARGGGSRTSRDQRDDYSVASLSELLGPSPPPAPVFVPPLYSPLTEVEDLRTWHPEGDDRPVRGVPSAATRTYLPSFSSGQLAFANPSRVVVCARRHQRREVLFAMRRTRKGAGARRRRTWRSNVSC